MPQMGPQRIFYFSLTNLYPYGYNGLVRHGDWAWNRRGIRRRQNQAFVDRRNPAVMVRRSRPRDPWARI